eukprot:TRINITY_DN12596_c0_g1_i1.p1 TRINITY_DN12596_c0_g1~~TRINITY_DN12596_c0_g1_i1.p1  ORF type:complete len:103 (-),score=15.65 TRINITY_DN12596_c0_g1_i1:57-365(-)
MCIRDSTNSPSTDSPSKTKEPDSFGSVLLVWLALLEEHEIMNSASRNTGRNFFNRYMWVVFYPKNCSKVSPLKPVSYTHLRAHETVLDLVCRLLLEKKKNSE